MFQALQALLAPALMERLVLVVNHVLSGEPAATERLAPHAGRVLRLELEGWPRLLPAPPRLVFRITPAALIEWAGADEAPVDADLVVRSDASNPAAMALRALAGETPALAIDGDAQFAADIDWLTRNLRWDVAADLERVFGPVVAHEVARLGSLLARGLRAAVQAVTPAGPNGPSARP
jgi:ubiquinone biosynthesis accessory factor UbiJ